MIYDPTIPAHFTLPHHGSDKRRIPPGMLKDEEPLINCTRARRRLCEMTRVGFGERSLVVPNERAETARGARRALSRRVSAGRPPLGR